MKPSGYRPDIDGLRAIAILAVVAYHAGVPGARGGYVGVDVFFAISGYLITGLLVAEASTRGTVSIIGFYARRVRRLSPALAAVLITVLVLGAALLPPFGEKAALDRSAVAASLFVANEFFRLTAGDYFDDPASLLPLLHLWSLSVEEQFYIFWPLGLALLCRLKPPAGPGFRPWALGAVLAGSAASLLLAQWLIAGESRAAFFSTAARAWELGAGCIAALLPARRLSAPAREAFAAAGFLLIAGAIAGFDAATPFPGLAATLPVGGTVLLLLAHRQGQRTRLSGLLESSAAVRIGLLSYGWYLWHWPLLALARQYRLGESNLPQDLALVAIALVLAAISYRWLEIPARQRGPLTKPSRQVALTGLAAMISIAGIASALWLYEREAPLSGAALQARDIWLDRSAAREGCTVSPRAWAGAVPREHCQIGAPPELAIWGDSHADAWAALFDSAAPERGTVQLSMNACPPLLGLQPRVPGIHGLANCPRFNDAVLAYLAATPTIRGVILTARWPAYAGGLTISLDRSGAFSFSDAVTGPEASLSAFEAGLTRSLESLQRVGLHALVLLSPPEFPHPLPRCMLVRGIDECGISRADHERYVEAIRDVATRVVARTSNARLFDPTGLLCNSGYCPAFVDGIATLRDDDHVSASAARRVGRTLEQDVAWLLSGTR